MKTLHTILFVVIIVALSSGSACRNPYEVQKQHALETVLKQDLKDLRLAIDEYEADKEELPGSIENLVKAGYLREVPVDPITNKREWEEQIGEITDNNKVHRGVKDVFSKAPGKDSNGTPYNKY